MPQDPITISIDLQGAISLRKALCISLGRIAEADNDYLTEKLLRELISGIDKYEERLNKALIEESASYHAKKKAAEDVRAETVQS